ncbi:12230_t:CDS:1, partial [Dentiscutata erythropus]
VPILWRRIEFSVEGYRQNQCGKNTSGPLYWRLMKIKRVMCGKTKHLYCSNMVYLKLAGLKISDTLLSAILRLCPNIHTLILDRSYGFSNIPIIEIARCCPKLLHLSFDACKAITDRCISEIVRSCPKLEYIHFASICSLNVTGASVIEIAQFCPNLIYLNLSSHHRIKDISFCAIE